VFFADVLFARICVQTVPLCSFNAYFKFSSLQQSSDWTWGWSRYYPRFPAIFLDRIVAKSRKWLWTDYVGLKIISSQSCLFGYDRKCLVSSSSVFCCGIQEHVSGSQCNTVQVNFLWLTLWRRNYYFFFKFQQTLYIKCEQYRNQTS